MTIPVGKDNCIAPSWVDSQKWIPVEMVPGKCQFLN